jgi:hypothetical protein
MDTNDVTDVITNVSALVREHYVDPQAAAVISKVLAAGLADGRYTGDEQAVADLVTADLQSVNGDKHLRLLYHPEPLAERTPGDDAEEYAALASWANRTGGGIAQVMVLPGNVGCLDLQPVLFPASISGEAIAAAMTLISSTSALIIDLRQCLGGEPTMVPFICSYLLGTEPVELSGYYERCHDRIRQSWTLPYVPGRRYDADRPVYVLTSTATFSGAEHLAYDLQQLGRATIVGETTRGGAHPREGFRITAHLEATISVARSVSPITGGNWEGGGVKPDIAVPAERARERALEHALERVGSQLAQGLGQPSGIPIS